jgi:flavorubredoxin
MAAVLEELGKKKVQGRKAFSFGSYGWSGGAQKELDEIMNKYCMNWNFIEPVEFKGSPKEEDLGLIKERVRELVKEVREAVNS